MVDVYITIGLCVAGLLLGLGIGGFMGYFRRQAHTTKATELSGVLDKEFRSELQASSRAKIEKEIDRDTTKLGEQLSNVSKQVNDYIKSDIEHQVVTGLGDLQKSIDELQAYMSIEIKKTTEGSEARSKEILEELASTLKQGHQTIELSMQKNAESLEQETKALITQTQNELAIHKQRMTDAFTNNMASVVDYYLKQTLGEKLDLDAQLSTIIAGLNEHKAAMIEDMSR